MPELVYTMYGGEIIEEITQKNVVSEGALQKNKHHKEHTEE